MVKGEPVTHKGIVDSIHTNQIKVKFTNLSACAECHAKSVCSAADMEDKEVMVNDKAGIYRTGDHVDVIMSKKQGFQAVLIGYVYPFLVVLALLVLLTESGISELRSGIISAGSLIPYYLIVFLLKDRINNKFQFSIRKPTKNE